jgi:hypothetical protein
MDTASLAPSKLLPGWFSHLIEKEQDEGGNAMEDWIGSSVYDVDV